MTEEEKLIRKRVSGKRFYLKHRDEILKRQREYKKANKEKCKEISRRASAKYNLLHKEKRNRDHREYYRKNRERRKEDSRRWYYAHREVSINRSREWNSKHKKARYENHKRWIINNRERARRYRSEYLRNKRRNDLQFKIQETLRTRFGCAIRRFKAGKKVSAIKDLGCPLKDFIIYMESKFQPGMSWKNQGEWHIDHIRPLASFDLTKTEEQKKAVHFSNLQPLWAKDNRIKKDKWETCETTRRRAGTRNG